MVKVIAENYVRKPELEKAMPMYRELVEETRKEPGCIAYEVFQDNKDETHIVFIEEWESQAILEKHFQTPHFTRLVPELGKLAEKEGAVATFKKIM